MQIFIPTFGRSSKQATYSSLVGAGLQITLVVQDCERDLYCGLPHVVLPASIRTIAPTRQFILEHLVEDKTFCMVDDDLVFFKRRDDDPTKLRDITPLELRQAFAAMHQYLLDGYAHVGFAAREGANRNTGYRLENTRIMRVLGYRADLLEKHNINFDDMEVMEDFDVAIRLLRQGYKNLVLNDYAHNQASSGAAGGCSHFRTPALQARNAKYLAERHHPFVRVTEKTTKAAWGGGTRTDVTVYWKKAYAESLE